MKKKRRRAQPVFKEYNQDQLLLLPPSLEELVPKNHVVRIVNKAIDQMNIHSIVKTYKGGGTSSYHPKMMLKVLIYAYTQRVYSSRQIAKALRENIHFMWLSGNNRPDFRTINRFRAEQLQGTIIEVFTLVVGLLSDHGLIKLENYFLDGTKIEADANKYSFIWKKSTERYKSRLQKQIVELLARIDTINDEENRQYGDRDLEELGEENPIHSEEIEAKIDELNKILAGIPDDSDKKKDLKELEESFLPRLKKYEKQESICGARNSYSKTDHDATFMRMKEDHMKNGQLKAGYNVQIGTENQFIIGYSIHQKPTDTTTFIPHLEMLKKQLGKLPDNVIADAGYGSEENYEYLKAEKVGNFVKYNYFHFEQKRAFKNNPYRAENFPYNPDTDEFTCPAGKAVRFTGMQTKKSETGFVQQYRIYTADNCKWCRRRKECHRSKYNRTIKINENLNTFKERVRENLLSTRGKALRSLRPVETESVFGQIKHNRMFKRFRLRGLNKVNIEWGLVSIAHNFLKMSSSVI
ncbi:MAG: IS1182 family transposase [Methanosarcina sp.]|nr:IS1182 family transposase [Methanosarcina sp.]